MPTLIIHAPNIHISGGKRLLLDLLKSKNENIDIHALLDSRLKIPDKIHNDIKIIRVKPNIWPRIICECKLKFLTKKNDKVLCFGNLPPLFRLKSKVILFIQNRYLVDYIPLGKFKLRAKIRIIFERIWLRFFINNVDRIIVQTKSMAIMIRQTLKCEADIFPFLDKHLSENETKDKIYDFLYIATPEPHKNHNNLILAWIILSEENINPHLCLALNNSERLFNNKLKDLIIEFNLKITIINNISGDDIQKLYYKSKALIFPSTFESFGIPLLEAKYHNLPIVASEKDYVRDIINPTETFDPDSPISIARAVKRFFGYTENYNKIYTSSEFLYYIKTL